MAIIHTCICDKCGQEITAQDKSAYRLVNISDYGRQYHSDCLDKMTAREMMRDLDIEYKQILE